MNELVIDAPELQSPAQRTGSVLINVCGWLLWLYVSFPLLTVCGLILHLDFCSTLIHQVGGEWGLRSLLQVYGLTLAGLCLMWSVWIVFRLRTRHQDVRAVRPSAVTDAELCDRFQVESSVLTGSRESRSIDVAFDNRGQIVALFPKLADKSAVESQPVRA